MAGHSHRVSVVVMSTTDDAEGGFNLSVFEAGMRAQRALNEAHAADSFEDLAETRTIKAMLRADNIIKRLTAPPVTPFHKLSRRLAVIARRAIAEIKALLRAALDAAPPAAAKTWVVVAAVEFRSILSAAHAALRGAADHPEPVPPLRLLDVHNTVTAPRPGPVAGTVPAAA